jgi:hypothetical protein
MNPSRIISSLIYASGLVACTWVGGQAWLEGKRAHEEAETVRVQYYATTAQWDATKARFESITAYTNLETKRTTVQSEIRGMVIAEMKKCRKAKC